MILKHQNNPISIIQTRSNTHLRLNKTIKTIVPDSFFEKKKIALLTCTTDGLYSKRYHQALEIKKNYCRYHNYSCLIYKINSNDYELKNGWIKIYKLIEILANYDYVFCSDADVILTNRDIRIEDIILKYMNKNHSLLITTDFNSINSGNIIWKNCKKSYVILRKMLEIADNKIRYTLNKPFIPKGIYEQPTLIYLINNYIDVKASIKIIPQYILNSYTDIYKELKKPNIIKKVNNQINRCNWKENDFLIHFAGFNYLKNDKFIYNIENMIKKYVDIYYKKINVKEGIDRGKIK
jgi:hypothetical protein